MEHRVCYGKIKSDERMNYKRKLVNDETVANVEAEDIDLNIMFNCNNSNSKFSYYRRYC